MSSVTKNPIVLTSANYIVNWFVCNTKEKKQMELFNTLNVVQSDKNVVNFLKKNKMRTDRYNDFEKRYKEAIENE